MDVTTLKQIETSPVTVMEMPFGRGEFVEGAGDTIEWKHGDGRNFYLTQHAEDQLAGRLQVSKGYMNKCPADLRAYNYNYWTRHDGMLNLVARSTDHQGDMKVMGVVSPNFTPIDHSVLMTMVQENLNPYLEEHGLSLETIKLNRSWIDDVTGKMNVNLVLPGERQVGSRKVGDTVERGFHIVNDLSRDSLLQVTPYYLRLICTNGMTATHDMGMESRWTFRHGPGGFEDEVQGWLRGLIGNIAGGTWDTHFNQMDVLADSPVDPDIARDLIATMGRQYGNSRIAANVATWREENPEEDETLWSVANSFTAAAQVTEGPEELVAMEGIGGRVLANLVELSVCDTCHRPLTSLHRH